MKAPCRRALCAALIAALLGPGAASADGPAEPEAPLRVCLLAHNLPYSNQSDASGFDVAVAALAARRTKRRLVPVWIEADDDIQEIEDSDIPFARLASEACDAIFSVPGPARDTLAGFDSLVLGAPYYGAAFELVGCKDDVPDRLRALRGRSVAIQSQTVAHFALLMVGAEPRNYFSLGAALEGVMQHETDAALLWGPAIGWRLRYGQVSGLARRDPAFGACRFVDGYEPPAAVRWNLHVATLAGRPRLRESLDTALAELAASGKLRKLARGWGVPWHPPFDGTYSLGAVNALQQPPR